MHYKDGQEAKIGDLVRGKGYNVKDEKGELMEITGIVVNLRPGSETCNLTVTHLMAGALKDQDGELLGVHNGSIMVEGTPVLVGAEYGQCDHFELIARAKVQIVQKPVNDNPASTEVTPQEAAAELPTELPLGASVEAEAPAEPAPVEPPSAGEPVAPVEAAPTEPAPAA